MAITIIKGPDGVRTVYAAASPILQNRALQFSDDYNQYVEEAGLPFIFSGFNVYKVAGLAAGNAESGQLVRVITEGLVPGSGILNVSNVIPGDLIGMAAGVSGIGSGAGLVQPLLSGLGENAGKILGRSVMSGYRGSGIGIFVELG